MQADVSPPPNGFEQELLWASLGGMADRQPRGWCIARVRWSLSSDAYPVIS